MIQNMTIVSQLLVNLEAGTQQKSAGEQLLSTPQESNLCFAQASRKWSPEPSNIDKFKHKAS
jgi:hypothetical protein